MQFLIQRAKVALTLSFLLLLVACPCFAEEAELEDLYIGLALLNSEKIKEAIPYLKKGAGFSPKDAKQYVDRATAFNALGQYQSAVSDCNKAMELDPLRFDFLEVREHAYKKLEQLELAKKDHESQLNIPINGTISEPLKQKDLKSFDREIALHPRDPKVYVARADQFRLRHAEAKAIADFSKALSLKANDPEILSARANAFTALHDYPKAISDITKIISIKKMHPSLYLSEDPFLRRLKLYEYEGQYQEALKECQNLSFKEMSWIYRAELLIHLGRNEEALKECNKVLESKGQSQSGSNFLVRAAAYNALGQYQNALKDCAALLSDYPVYFMDSYCINSAHAYLGLENYEKCIYFCNAAIAIDSAAKDDETRIKLAKAYHLRAGAFARMGKNEEAKKDDQEANSLGYRS